MKTSRTLLTAIATLFFITSFAQSDLSGRIVYHNENETPLAGVELQIYDMDGNYLETTYTNSNGEYLFENLEVGTYTIEPYYDIEAQGADMGDASQIMLYLLGIIDFTEIQYLAADVNIDGEVTWDDYYFIVIDHFIFGEPFPGAEWVFEDMTKTIGSKEGGDDGGTSDDYSSSTGDVAGTWSSGMLTDETVISQYHSYKLLLNETTNVSLKAAANMDMNGTGLVIKYPAEYIQIDNVSTVFDDAKVNITEGEIRIAWVNNNTMNFQEGDELIQLETTLIQETDQDIRFILSNASHITDTEGQFVKYAAIEMPAITQNKNYLELNAITPNPLNTTSQVEIYVGQTSDVNVRIVDLSGKIIQIVTDETLSEGNHSININRGNLSSGIYMLQVQANENISTKKLVVK